MLVGMALVLVGEVLRISTYLSTVVYSRDGNYPAT